MNIVLLLFTGVATILIGKLALKRWFNHVTVYSTIWTISLVLFELRFIRYIDLRPETWLIIYSAWLAFVFGSVSGVFFSRHGGAPANITLQIFPPEKTIRSIIIFLTIISFIGVAYHWSVLFGQYGSLENILVMSSIRYTLRLQEGALSLPYFDSLALAGTAFAGLYAAKRGGVPIVALFPAAVVVISEIATVGRAKILMALILFVSSYLIGKQTIPRDDTKKKMKVFSTAIGVALILTLFIGGAELVRSSRGGMEAIGGVQGRLAKQRTAVLITPSVYMYATIHHGVFNDYLDNPNELRFFGQYTLGPFWRILNKLGVEQKMTEYAPFRNTPLPANTATYLKDIHADFDLPGVVWVPFFFGLVCSLVYLRATRTNRFSLFWVMVFIHLMVGVALTFLGFMLSYGFWMVSLLVSLAFSVIVDRNSTEKGVRA